jgi:hypothetical protein
MDFQEVGGVPLVSKDEAIAEVRRWLEVERVDPEAIFSATANQVIRYKDLIAHLDRDTPDGRILRFAISRGRVIKREGIRSRSPLLEIVPLPTASRGDPSSDPPPSDASTPPA